MAKAKIDMTKAATNKSSANNPSTLSKQKTSICLLPSSSWGEVGRNGAGTREVGRPGTNGHSGRSSTWPDLTKIKSRSGEPESQYVQSIPLRHWSTGFGMVRLRRKNTRQLWRDAMRMGSHQLRHNHHLYGTKASQATQDNTSGSVHHHPRSIRRSDTTWKWQPDDVDHSRVFRGCQNGWWIRRACRANACVRASTWITMVQHMIS